MVLIVIGALFVLTGIRALTQITEPGALPSMLVCFAIGGALLYLGYKKIKDPPPAKEPIPEPTAPPVPSSPPVGTFTFEPTGTRFECCFPTKGYAARQRVLMKSKVGDPVQLRVYEWEGKPAIAVVNARIGADLGVAKKTQSSKLNNLLNDYTVTGAITKFTDFDLKGENYLSCEVKLEYFEKT